MPLEIYKISQDVNLTIPERIHSNFFCFACLNVLIIQILKNSIF